MYPFGEPEPGCQSTSSQDDGNRALANPSALDTSMIMTSNQIHAGLACAAVPRCKFGLLDRVVLQGRICDSSIPVWACAASRAKSSSSSKGGRFIIIGKLLYNTYKITLQGHYALYIYGSVALFHLIRLAL